MPSSQNTAVVIPFTTALFQAHQTSAADAGVAVAKPPTPAPSAGLVNDWLREESARRAKQRRK